MKITFDIAEVEKLLKSFYTITGNRIVFFNDEFERIAAYPEQHLPYCHTLRKDQRARKACRLCEMDGFRKCKNGRGIYLYECHAGLQEVVLPLIDGELFYGYLMMGQVILNYGEEPEKKWKELRGHLADYKIDFAALESCFYNHTPVVTKEFLYSSATLMESCASHLYMKQSVRVQEEDLSRRIEAYITTNYRGDLSVQDICRQFHVSRSKLYRLTEHSFGKGVAEQIRQIRVREARRLLETTDLKISEIAVRVGYEDYNYFTKIFRRECGMTPRDYRKQFWEVHRYPENNRND